MTYKGGVAARAAIGLGALVLTLSAAAGANVLVPKKIYTDGDPGVSGLMSPREIATSPDGKNVYTAAEGSGAVTVWSRSADGSLKEIQVLTDGGSVSGLAFVDAVTVSSDGRNVYAGSTHGTLAVFARDHSTGKLSEIQVLLNGPGLPINGVVAIALSPDGKNAYVANTIDGAIVVFARNRRSGELSKLEVVQQGVGGITGLTGVFPVTVSGDGQNVYAGGRLDHTVLVFSRKANGSLTLIQTLQEGQNGVFGIDGARAICVAYEGNAVYVGGLVHNTLAVFSRSGSGKLSEIQLLVHKVNAGGLAVPTSIVESFDHLHLFVAGFASFAVDSFHRDRRTGKLTGQEQEIQDPGDGSLGLIQVISLAMSPGGANLYSVSFFSDTLNVFAIREKAHGPLGLPADGADDSGAAAGGIADPAGDEPPPL